MKGFSRYCMVWLGICCKTGESRRYLIGKKRKYLNDRNDTWRDQKARQLVYSRCRSSPTEQAGTSCCLSNFADDWGLSFIFHHRLRNIFFWFTVDSRFEFPCVTRGYRSFSGPWGFVLTCSSCELCLTHRSSIMGALLVPPIWRDYVKNRM